MRAFTEWPCVTDDENIMDHVGGGVYPVEVLRRVPVFDAVAVRYENGQIRFVRVDHVFTKEVSPKDPDKRNHIVNQYDFPETHPDCPAITFRELLAKATVKDESDKLSDIAAHVDLREYDDDCWDVRIPTVRVDTIHDLSSECREYWVTVLYYKGRPVSIKSYASKFDGQFEVFDRDALQRVENIVRAFASDEDEDDEASLDDIGEHFRYIAGTDILGD